MLKRTQKIQELIIVFLSLLVGLWAFFLSVEHAYFYNGDDPAFNWEVAETSSNLMSKIVVGFDLPTLVLDVLNSVTIHEVLIFFFFFLSFSIFGIRFCKGESKVADWFGKKHNLLIFGFFLALIIVALRLNGTSLYCWTKCFSIDKSQLPIWGVARSIRSDEYAIWTPLTISQEFTGYAKNSPLINGGGETTWVSVGGVPAWNKALIFKPLYWGFLLFGSSYGISILWTGRFILLFSASYLCALLYTENNRSLSFAAACMISLAPYVQWWYSQSVAEVILFPEFMILVLLRFFAADTVVKKILYAVLFSWLFGCLCMIGYPAWIIPAIYLLSVMVVFLAVKNREILQKKDNIYIGLPFLATLFWLFLIVRDTWPTLYAVKNSIYPGARLFTGGNIDKPFYTGLFSTLLQFVYAPTSNHSELSNFISFTPTGFLLTAYNDWKEKKVDAFSLILIFVELIILVFLCFGFPAAIAKMTLLSQCTRLVMLFGFTDVLLLIRALTRPLRFPVRFSIPLAVLLAGISTYLMSKELTVSNKGFIVFVFCLSWLSYTVLLACTLANGKNRFVSVFLIMLAVLCGGFVNPIQKGIGALTNSSVLTAMKEFHDDPDSVYLVEGEFPANNMLLAAGKRTFNSVQEYADLERWKPIDPNGEWVDLYNRFGDIAAAVTEGPSKMEFDGGMLRLKLNRNDFNKLGITYLLTEKKYEDPEFIKELSVDRWNLYRVR